MEAGEPQKPLESVVELVAMPAIRPFAPVLLWTGVIVLEVTDADISAEVEA